MAITKIFDSEVKQTPKQKAQDYLYSQIQVAVNYWQENRDMTSDMTQREIDLVNDQMVKIAQRLYAKL